MNATTDMDAVEGSGKAESVQNKLGKSLDEIIAETSEAKPQPHVNGRPQGTTNRGPIRSSPMQRNRNAQYGAVPYSNAANNSRFAYSVKVSGLPSKESPEALENLIRAHFSSCGRILKIVHKGPGEVYVGFDTTQACRQALAELNGSVLKGSKITVERGTRTTVAPQRPFGDANFPRAYPDMLGHPMAAVPAYHGAIPYPGYSHVPQAMPYSFGQPQYPGYSITHTPLLNQSPISSRRQGNQQATVIVSNVPSDLTAREIQDAFGCVGKVLCADVLLTSSGLHTGRVAVTFEHKRDALEAVRRFDGGDLNSQVIRVFLE